MDIVTLDEDEILARKAFGRQLQSAMDRRGLSHRRLAEEISSSKQSVTNWTQGTHEPSPLYLRRLSRVLRVPVADLVEQRTAPEIEDDGAAAILIALSKLRPALESLSREAPELLDLLGEAERQARKPRRTSLSGAGA